MSFDQKEATAKWRARLAETGTLFEADLDELESHLNDHIEALEELGIHGEEAFDTAVKQLGDTRALADEFAKVNPLLAWRAALFWMAAGIMLVLGGLPIQSIALHGLLIASLTLNVGQVATAIMIWLVVFASPFVAFSAIFRMATKTIEDPLPWARSRAFRISLILATAILLIVAHLGQAWGLFNKLEWKWLYPTTHPDMLSAWDHMSWATYALTIAGPLYLGVVAYRQRRLAMKNRVAAAPIFWLTIGLFIGAVRAELHEFVRYAALSGGGLAHVTPAQMNALMWIVTLACPLLLFASAYAYLRHRAPGPSTLMRTRGILLALAGSGGIGIAAVFLTNPVARRGVRHVAIETFLAGHTAYVLAGIVTSAMLPVLIGALLLRLRPSARLAAFRTD